jgi:hypothetical protein
MSKLPRYYQKFIYLTCILNIKQIFQKIKLFIKKIYTMRGYFGLSQISEDERSNILKQHKHIYNGYRTMQPEMSNTQPLYVQDFANDKGGITVDNKGNVKPYMNKGINEQVEEVCDECGSMEMEESKGACNECGGMMYEGECSECGWKGEVGAMEEQIDDEIEWEEDYGFDEMPIEDDSIFGKEKKKEFRPGVDLGKSFEKFKGMMDMDEETGHLDDIYDEEDLNPSAGFDYIEGSSNDVDTFKERYKKLKEQNELDEIGTHELKKGRKYKLNFPSVEDELEYDDETGEKTKGEKMYKFKGKKHGGHLLPSKHIEKYVSDLDEQGGNADDMDVDDVLPPFNFATEGPMAGGDTYPVNEYDDDVMEYETMESAWADDIDENDVSGVQGVYGDMKSAYDFDSEGPGKAGPYQTRSESGYEGEDEDVYWDNDMEDDELDLDITKFNPEDKSWEEITAHTGDDEFAHIDEDLRESLISQKNRIMEMMSRMKVIK